MTETSVVPPTPEEVRREKNPSRVAVLKAMVRMLNGTPERIPKGRLSVASLAVEAEVNRNRLTKGDLNDLGLRFAGLIEARSRPTTAMEIQLVEELDRLKVKYKDLTEVHRRALTERDEWKRGSHSLARAVQVLEMENAALRTQKAALVRSVESLRKQVGRRRLETVPTEGGDS